MNNIYIYIILRSNQWNPINSVSFNYFTSDHFSQQKKNLVYIESSYFSRKKCFSEFKVKFLPLSSSLSLVLSRFQLASCFFVITFFIFSNHFFFYFYIYGLYICVKFLCRLKFLPSDSKLPPPGSPISLVVDVTWIPTLIIFIILCSLVFYISAFY